VKLTLVWPLQSSMLGWRVWRCCSISSSSSNSVWGWEWEQGLVTPPSLHSPGADSDRLRQGTRSSSSRVRGQSAPLAAAAGEKVETIDHGMESKCSMTSTHPYLLG
jgi:hypothetical protein